MVCLIFYIFYVVYDVYKLFYAFICNRSDGNYTNKHTISESADRKYRSEQFFETWMYEILQPRE